jgi:hypothetical protein
MSTDGVGPAQNLFVAVGIDTGAALRVHIFAGAGVATGTGLVCGVERCPDGSGFEENRASAPRDGSRAQEFARLVRGF